MAEAALRRRKDEVDMLSSLHFSFSLVSHYQQGLNKEKCWYHGVQECEC
jgi:hypothetical protein